MDQSTTNVNESDFQPYVCPQCHTMVYGSRHACVPYEEELFDIIENPAHYGAGDLTAMDIIEIIAPFYDNPVEGYCVGTLIKYLYRSPHKGNKLQDLKKARWFLNKLIELNE